MKKILVIHGPNLNLLGEREPEHYGTVSFAELNRKIKEFARKRKVQIKVFQSNGEGELIDFIHKHRRWAEGMIINPGAYTHYSYAIRDAVAAMKFPTVEVHLTDIYKREKFRRVSVIAPVCIGQVYGLGWRSYLAGIEEVLRTVR